jgi:hypothetical protein
MGLKLTFGKVRPQLWTQYFQLQQPKRIGFAFALSDFQVFRAAHVGLDIDLEDLLVDLGSSFADFLR